MNKKSKSLFDFENRSIQQSYQENNKISKIELEKNQNKQLYQATSTKNIKSRTKSREKDELFDNDMDLEGENIAGVTSKKDKQKKEEKKSEATKILS